MIKPLQIQILLSLIVCHNSIASITGPVVEERDHIFKPNESRKIINATVKDDKILLLTRESDVDQGFVGCFTFGQHRLLQNAYTFLLKKRPESIDSILHIYAFGQDRNIILGGITSTHSRSSIDYLWFNEPRGTVFTKPKLILQDRTDSLGKWWLLKVGKSRKLFILKQRLLRSKSVFGLERQKGWLHCYNLDDINKPKLEGVTRIDSNEFDFSSVECAADKNKDVYIWQTIHKKGKFKNNSTNS